MNYAFLSPRDLAFHLRIQEGDIAALVKAGTIPPPGDLGGRPRWPAEALDQIKAAMMQKTHGVKTADDVI